jgi:light-regulated signal transduction histidine kinase (bacteriophytochrome)
MIGVLILIGAAILVVALVQTRRIFQLLDGSDDAKWWRVLMLLMGFFAVGYVGAAVAAFAGEQKLLALLAGVVFFAGAGFVLIVVNLGRGTIERLRDSMRKEAEQGHMLERTLATLQTTNLQLSSSNRELEQFAYVTSHDLQEPLRKITAFGDLLKTTEAARLSEDGAMYVDRMQKSARRMSDLINALLTFSRVSKSDEDLRDVDLRKLVGEVDEDLETALKAAGTTLQVGALPTIHARATQMRQLLQNLISNALKFKREGVAHVVSVTGEETPTCYQVHVSDNGIGFEQQYAERIFGVFQRLHGRNTYEGTGIGLAICQRVVVNHGWTLEAHGRPNEGATFTIRIKKEDLR